MSLPGDAPAKLAEIYGSLSVAERGALEEHILGGTSAERLADVLTRHGHPIGATTIKSYVRNLKQIGLLHD